MINIYYNSVVRSYASVNFYLDASLQPTGLDHAVRGMEDSQQLLLLGPPCVELRLPKFLQTPVSIFENVWMPVLKGFER